MDSSPEQHPSSGETLHPPVLRRLLAVYARPFLALIALSIILSLVFGAGQYLRAYLIKPILDDVLLPSSQLEGITSDWLPDLGSLGSDATRESKPTSALSPEPKTTLEKQRLENQLRESVVNIVLLSLLVIFAMPVAQFGRTYLVEYMLGLVYIEMQRDVCAKLLSLPLRYHQDRQRGDILSRTLQDIRGAHAAISLLFSDFIQAILTASLGTCMLLFISWRLALVFALLGPCLFVIISAFTRKISNSARRRQETYADVTQRLIEILEGIKVIKAFRAEAAEGAAFRRETHTLFRRSMRVVKKRILARSLVEVLNNGMAIGTLIVGMVFVVQGWWSLTPGDLAAFAAVLATTYKPIKSLAKGWVRLIDAQPSAERFFEIIDSPVEIQDALGAVEIETIRRGIELRGVSFSYGREPVLRDISLEVRAGEVAALIGPTGSGKTTLVDLLLRFYDPTAGVIEVDGIDLRQIQRDSLYKNVSVVTQEPFLFDGSILENIRFGKPGASDAEVMEAARAANVDEFATQFPDGFETEVGAAGVRLSGGQRQRVTIARAILRNPSFLIFDEATSSLDSKSERLVQDAIEALFGDRTVLLVAHRLSTVARADKIIVLENGCVTQLGTHADLMGQGGLYRELVGLQA
jgi:subfamily B ATP-binding cassette protein MsbA